MHQQSNTKLNCLKLAFLDERPENATRQIRCIRRVEPIPAFLSQQILVRWHVLLFARHKTGNLTEPINDFICSESIRFALAEFQEALLHEEH